MNQIVNTSVTRRQFVFHSRGLLALGLLDRLPDARRRHRHLQMPDAVIRQRVDHRIGDGGSPPEVPASPQPLAPSGLLLVGTGWLATSIIGASCARGMA